MSYRCSVTVLADCQKLQKEGMNPHASTNEVLTPLIIVISAKMDLSMFDRCLIPIIDCESRSYRLSSVISTLGEFALQFFPEGKRFKN